MNFDRVYFYSIHDGSCVSNLLLAEKKLDHFYESIQYDINDIIELYQIKLYVDNKVFLPEWTEQYKLELKDKVRKLWSVIVQFWNKINSNNLIELFGQLECWTLQDSFWQLTSNLSVFRRISKDSFALLINQENCNIKAILHQEKIVEHYSSEIRDFLMRYDKSAELLLCQLEEKHDRVRCNYFFSLRLDISVFFILMK